MKITTIGRITISAAILISSWGMLPGDTTYATVIHEITPGSQAVMPSQSALIEKVIAAGHSYLGTPYEFGSDRHSTRTFDCSDFVRHAYLEAIDHALPADSRKQAAYVKEQGNLVDGIDQLKRGDLVFFMSYKGSQASDYTGINPDKEKVTHVGIYLGNGEMLHTYSNKSGGVRIDLLDGTWEYRFLYGGSVF